MQKQAPQTLTRIFRITRDNWEIFKFAMAESTLNAYAAAIIRAAKKGQGPIPVIDQFDIMQLFAPMRGQSWASICLLRQALIAFQAMGGLPSPPFDDKGMSLFFRGLKKMAPPPPLRRLPMTREIAIPVFTFWFKWPSLAAQRNAAFFLLQLASLQRFEQVANARHSDFTDNGVGRGLNWFIPHSKTDQERKGTSIALPENMGSELPVSQVLRVFLKLMPRDGGFLFRPTRKATKKQTWTPRFVTQNRRRTTTQAMIKQQKTTKESCVDNAAWNLELRHAISRLFPDIDASRYSSHSLRSGGATSLIEQGVSFEECSLLLGHTSQTAVHAYHKQRQEHARMLLSKLYSPHA